MGAPWGSRLAVLIYINDTPGYAGLFAFHLVEAQGETGIKQWDEWERSNRRGVWCWKDGEIKVYTPVNACEGVHLPLAMHDAILR